MILELSEVAAFLVISSVSVRSTGIAIDSRICGSHEEDQVSNVQQLSRMEPPLLCQKLDGKID